MELNDFNGVDLPSQLKLLPFNDLRSKLSRIPNFDDFDVEENYIILGKKNLLLITLLLIGLLSMIHRFPSMTILTIYKKKLLNVLILTYQRRKLLKIPET